MVWCSEGFLVAQISDLRKAWQVFFPKVSSLSILTSYLYIHYGGMRVDMIKNDWNSV